MGIKRMKEVDDQMLNVELTKDMKIVLQFIWEEYELVPKIEVLPKMEIGKTFGSGYEKIYYYAYPYMVAIGYSQETERTVQEQKEGKAFTSFNGIYYYELIDGKTVEFLIRDQAYPFCRSHGDYDEENDTLIITMRPIGEKLIGYKTDDYDEKCRKTKENCDQFNQDHQELKEAMRAKEERRKQYENLSWLRRLVGGKKLRNEYFA